jgi:hypothetical protein
MTTPTTPTVTLSKIKYAAFASEETNCFEATVLIDGKPAGTVSNEGRGGCDNFHPRALQQQLNEIAAALPPIDTEYNLKNDAELLIGKLFENYLLEKELKKALKKRILFTKSGGKLYQTNVLSSSAAMSTTRPSSPPAPGTTPSATHSVSTQAARGNSANPATLSSIPKNKPPSGSRRQKRK